MTWSVCVCKWNVRVHVCACTCVFRMLRHSRLLLWALNQYWQNKFPHRTYAFSSSLRQWWTLAWWFCGQPKIFSGLVAETESNKVNKIEACKLHAIYFFWQSVKLMLFQTCISIWKWNKKGDILKNLLITSFHAITMNYTANGKKGDCKKWLNVFFISLFYLFSWFLLFYT